MNDNQDPNPEPRAAFTPPFTFTDFLVGIGCALLVYVLLTAAIVLAGPQ